MDWFGVVMLWLGAAILAVKTGGLRPVEGAPAFLTSDFWGYAPLGLVTLALLIMVFRAARPHEAINGSPAVRGTSVGRRLTTQQRVLFKHSMGSLGGLATVRAISGGVDTFDYRDDILRAFAEAGWETRSSAATGLNRMPSSGVALCFFKGRGRTASEEAVAHAFEEAGIQFDWREEQAVDPDDGVLVLVTQRQ